MKTRTAVNRYMKERRDRLAREGICTDCQRNRVRDAEGKVLHIGCPEGCRRNHAVCEVCREARRARLAANRRQLTLPVFGMPLKAPPYGRLSTERGKSSRTVQDGGL